MSRRLLPVMVALALALVALAWVLFRLHRGFAEETNDARRQVAFRRAQRERATRSALGRALDAQLEASLSRAVTALQDPLSPDADLLLRRGEHQWLPRTQRPQSRSDASGRALHEALRHGFSVHRVPPAWAAVDSALLGLEAGAALEPARREPVAQAEVDRWPPHRPFHDPDIWAAEPRDTAGVGRLYATAAAAGRSPADLVPALVAVAEHLRERALAPELLTSLVSGGPSEGLAGPVFEPGLQRRLLGDCGAFSQVDVDALAERIVALSAGLGLPTGAFEARLAELHTGVFIVPRFVTEPSLFDGRWYLVPEGETLRGSVVDLSRTLAAVTEELKKSGALSHRDQLSLVRAPGLEPLASLQLQLDAPDLASTDRSLVLRSRAKGTLLWACWLFAMAIGALALVAQHRKAQYLALKDSFVAAVSHELRTPLASIRLLAETLTEKPHGELVRDYAGRIVAAADGLHLLVENVLSFGRLGGRRAHLSTSRLRVEELAQHLEAELRGHARRPVEVRVSCADLEIDADDFLVRLLLSNLARNACAYNNSPSVTVNFDARRASTGETVISIQDNGVGIPGDEWSRVFDDFYRLPGHAREHTGFGLGLALCRRIMEAHRGSIGIHSSSPRGTRFELRFPEERP